MSNSKISTKKNKKENIKKESYFDYSLLAVLVFLVCFGLIMLYSASSYDGLTTYGDSMHYLKRQLIFTVAGFIGVAAIIRIPTSFYYKTSGLWYGLALFLMALVQSPLGKTVNGARRWIQLPGGQQLQPAEIAKIAVILFVPWFIIYMGKSYKKKGARLRVIVVGGIQAAGAMFLTDNLSTALIILGITAIILVVSHPNTKSYIVAFLLAVSALVVGVIYFSTHISTSTNFRVRRLLIWLSPESDPTGDGFQTLQGLYAIGSGGVFGKGLGNSTQKMVIPEVQNDMILSVICEELGIFGAVMVLLLFGLLLYRLLFIIQNAPDLYSALVVTGIFAHIAIQVILNIGVVTNLIPNTGVTLPFISYGGTSTLFLLAEIGIALGVSKRIKIE
ncbi:MAG: FtsW/RodA/SpoVE family cell cycle protein [Suipraeoptans sp.]